VRSFAPTLRSVQPAAPLVEHASCSWGTYARLETAESIRTLVLGLLDGYDKHISSTVLSLRDVGAEEQLFGGDGAPTGFTGLHGVTYFGCLDLTAALLETNKLDALATDFHGNSEIAWASRGGNEGVMRVLLEWSEVHSEIPNNKYGSAPLSVLNRLGPRTRRDGSM